MLKGWRSDYPRTFNLQLYNLQLIVNLFVEQLLGDLIDAALGRFIDLRLGIRRSYFGMSSAYRRDRFGRSRVEREIRPHARIVLAPGRIIKESVFARLGRPFRRRVAYSIAAASETRRDRRFGGRGGWAGGGFVGGRGGV